MSNPRVVSRSVRLLLAVLLAVAGPLASTAAPASADATTAVVRSAHFSPDTAGVDVYLQAVSGGRLTLWITGETYGEVSGYQRLTPGVYAVSMRPHGAPASTPAAVTWTLDARAGRAYTAAAIGRNAALQAIVLSDDPSPVPADSGRVRLVQAVSQAAVSVEANGGLSLADALTFGVVTPYRTVPVGTWDVRATATGGSATGPATAKVAVPAGSSSTVVVVDTPTGALGLLAFVDSGGAGTAPVGGIDAGAGGTAPGSGSALPAALAAGSGALLAAGAALYLRRRRADGAGHPRGR
jgi:hypothetical protein